MVLANHEYQSLRWQANVTTRPRRQGSIKIFVKSSSLPSRQPGVNVMITISAIVAIFGEKIGVFPNVMMHFLQELEVYPML
jgi:hypothetical protein